MPLHASNLRKGSRTMKCKHDDCFTCPYPDCIIGSAAAYKDPKKLEESRRKRQEYQKEYYRKRKAKAAGQEWL